MSLQGKYMKAAVYYNNNDVRLEDKTIPELGPGDLLVKMEACGLCSGETYEEYQLPRGPRVQGHEPTGVVVEVGKEVEKFEVGDRVYVHHHVPCMSCHWCNRGFFTQCEHWDQTRIDPGGFAEYFRVPVENAQFDTLILPENVSFEEGTLVEPMACTLRGLWQTKIHPGDSIAVMGTGFMGLSFVQLAQLWPVSRIFAVDLNDWRLGKAIEMGANHAINPSRDTPDAKLRDLNQGRGVDAVFVTAPNVRALNTALSLCDKGATLHINSPAPKGEPWPVEAYDLFFREITIHCAYSANHLATRAVLELISAGKLDAKSLITHRFGLDRIGDAIQLILAAGESLKPIIIPTFVAEV